MSEDKEEKKKRMKLNVVLVCKRKIKETTINKAIKKMYISSFIICKMQNVTEIVLSPSTITTNNNILRKHFFLLMRNRSYLTNEYCKCHVTGCI